MVTAEALSAVDLPDARRDRLRVRAQHAVRLAFLEKVIEVAFDDGEAAARFAGRYARFQTAAIPAARAYAVRDAATTVLWYEGGGAYEWPSVLGDPIDLDFLIDSVVRREFFNDLEGCFTFHAAAVVTARGAVAIVAPSTGGKTTTAVACARRGMPLLGDEECIVRDGVVVPFPRAINLRADGIERLLADAVPDDFGIATRLRAHRGGAWTCVDFADLFGHQPLPPPQPLVATYFLRVGRAAAIAPLPLGEAIPGIFAAWPRGRERGVARVARIVRLLHAAPPFALTLGSPDATARAIEAAHR